MKLIAVVLTLMLTGVCGFAQEQVADAEKQESVQEISSPVVDQPDQKKEIQKEDLPEQVVTEFNQSVYKEWTMAKIFMIGSGEQASYELHLTQGEEKMVLLADANGTLQPKADS